MKFYDYILEDVKGHVEVYKNNEFQFSADTKAEARYEIEKIKNKC